jgi:hypothetical protein
MPKVSGLAIGPLAATSNWRCGRGLTEISMPMARRVYERLHTRVVAGARGAAARAKNVRADVRLVTRVLVQQLRPDRVTKRQKQTQQ